MPVDVSSLTIDELETFITTRLIMSRIDLSQLPTVADPVTGAPTQAQALASLRSFVLATPEAINSWRPAAPAVSGVDPLILSQEVSPPLEYPSIAQAWTGLVGR